MKKLKTQLAFMTVLAVASAVGTIVLIYFDLSFYAIFTSAFSAVIALFTAVWFAGHVTAPVAKLTEFAQRIASGTYGIQLEAPGPDEIGQLTAEINNMSEKVAIAEKSRTDFISQVSHELRTPLTAITGWAETIAYDENLQPDSLRGLGIISKEAERLSSMVAELLEFTRIQDGRFNLRIEMIDISAELEDAVFTYGELMRQAGVKVNYTGIEDEILEIPGDPERLKQVFLNLLDNALTHGSEGKQIDVQCKKGVSRVEITVRDYGRGIPEAELPHVKEKFYKGSGRSRGSGIGLAVCDEIIARHDGELIIENAEGGGCLVTVYLPMKVK